MWTLILIVYVGSINYSEIGMVRGFTIEAACEAAGEIAATKVRGARFAYLCVPTAMKAMAA